jgi:mannose-6-phosphate isomerase-like protein (cupin superfamily)
MSDDVLIRLAQRASSDPDLMASLIAQYCAARDAGWEQAAEALGLEAGQLAKLALCRRPRPDRFDQDTALIAQYVGLEAAALARFVHDAQRAAAHRFETAGRPPSPAARRPAYAVETGEAEMRRPIWQWALVAVGVLVVLAMVFARPERAEATLVVTAGQVTVHQQEPVVLVFTRPVDTVLSRGEAVAVRAGDSIALDAGASAELRLLDGSTVTLGNQAELTVNELRISSRAYHVALDVTAGNIYSRVERLLSAQDRFEVRTPSSTASVRGTAFAVQVISPEASYFACDEGIVAVRLGDQEVEVSAGQQVIATVGEPLRVEPKLDTTPPALSIFSPSEPPAPGSTVEVRGLTEPGATVTIDGDAVVVGADGTFAAQVAIDANPIIIVAEDAAGNTISISINPME